MKHATQLVRDMIGKNSASDEYDKKYPTTKFKDLTRRQKDEVHKAMKNPNWHEGPIENLTEQELKKERELERQHRKKHSSYY